MQIRLDQFDKQLRVSAIISLDELHQQQRIYNSHHVGWKPKLNEVL